MSTFLYQGHGSFRVTTNKGTVIYVDPYAGEGYDAPADIVLISHQHGDHNQIGLITQKPGCVVITEKEAQKDGQYQSFDIKDVRITAVPAYNKNHKREENAGFLVFFDEARFYFPADTSTTDYMPTLKGMNLTHAVWPIDGYYNMDAAEASACARVVGAKHNIPTHMKPGALFDMDVAKTFDGPGRLIVEAGQSIEV